LQNKILKLLVLLSFWGCSQSDIQSNLDYQNMEFKIDSKLLTLNSISINDLEFNTPKNWLELDSIQLITLKSIFSQDSLLNVFELINGQSDGSSLLLIGQSETINKSYIINNFPKKLEKSFPSESIHFNKFKINDVKVDQFIAINSTHTSFHLFIDLDNLYLIEFLVPLETYEKQIQTIESTIGTIKKGKKNENNS